MPIKDFRKALKVIPIELGISAASFNNYRAIQLDDKQDIPHAIVDKLEKLFSLKPGDLQNYVTETQPIANYSDNESGE